LNAPLTVTAHTDILSLDQPVVLFDGSCGICSSWVDFIMRRDRAGVFRFIALQSEEGGTLLQKVGLPRDYLDSVVLLDRQGTWTHSTAVFRVLGRLDGLLRMASWLLWLPRPLRDFAYRCVARSRHGWLGGNKSCRRPDSRKGELPNDPPRY
jgi:predicted DCC family thiol-disulfide oxidoreductase YuxK